MVKLITLLVAGVPAIIASVIAFMARKWGTAVASIALLVAIAGAFAACIQVILQTLFSLLAVPGFWSSAIGMFIPADFSAVLAAIMSGRICRWAFDLAVLKTKMFNNAS